MGGCPLRSDGSVAEEHFGRDALAPRFGNGRLSDLLGFQEWRRGAHIPREYMARQYWVEDWRAHRLAPPPRGYQWVQVGNDYVLVAIASGIIAQLSECRMHSIAWSSFSHWQRMSGSIPNFSNIGWTSQISAPGSDLKIIAG